MMRIARFISLSFILILLLFNYAAADTTYVAAGAISGAWTVENSPYVVNEGNVLIREGISLFIMPGVKVCFGRRCKMIIRGRLFADGTEQDSIIFTDLLPSSSTWGGLKFLKADDGSSLSYCLVENVRGEHHPQKTQGGGILINECTVNISHCTLKDNKTFHNSIAQNQWGQGGGVNLFDGRLSVIEYCLITDNEALQGGGIYLDRDPYSTMPDEMTIRNNIIQNNTAKFSGGGIYVGTCNPIITDNIIRNNLAHSIHYGGGGIILWTTTNFYGNTAIVTNNLIEGNSASEGGGIYSRHDGSSFFNNTIVNNFALDKAGGFYIINNANVWPFLINNIIWDNTAEEYPGLYLRQSSNPSLAEISYCNIQDSLFHGAGNISDDPDFVSGPWGEYYLSQLAAGQTMQSPCTDAGHPFSSMIEGTTRTDEIQDVGIVDMGFHYSISPAEILSAEKADDSKTRPPYNSNLLSVFPNPFNASTTISFNLPTAGNVSLKIYDLTGREVQTLQSGRLSAGIHRLNWNAQTAASGIYFAVLEANGMSQTRKMLLLK